MLTLFGGASVLGYKLDLWEPDVIWPFLLIGVGVLLFRRDPAPDVYEPTED